MMNKLLGLPVLASEHGAEVDKLILYVHYLMALLFVGWMCYFLYALYRFRATKSPKADYVGVKGHLSSYLEVGVALIEGILLIGFAVPLWAKVVDAGDFPKESESTVIRVTAEQFNWNFRYPGKDGKFGRQDIKFLSSTNQLALDPTDPAGKDDIIPPVGSMNVPVNKPVLLQLTSKDVIHSFKLLPMRVTQDAIPGMSIPIHFRPNTVGIYPINCAQLCGLGHSGMKGTLNVMTQADFEKWLASKGKGGGSSFE